MRSLHLCRKSEPPPRILESKTAVMDTIDSLRQQLVNLLTKAEAHVDVASTLKDFPPPLRGRKPEGAPHTPWQLLEHMRLAQWDILHFSVDAKHVSPKWPEGYWPKRGTPPNDKAWKESVQQFLGDLDDICDLVRDKKRDLFAPMPHGDGQTLLREVLLVADHNSYHLGQLVMVRKTLEG
jgi:DinB superfamily